VDREALIIIGGTFYRVREKYSPVPVLEMPRITFTIYSVQEL
jgi:hypothetical protein